MKKSAIIIFLVFSLFTASAQHKKLDTLRLKLSEANTDTLKYTALRRLGTGYFISKPDSSIIFEQQAYLIAKKNNWVTAQCRTLNGMANAYATMGDYATGIQFYLKALQGYSQLKDEFGMHMINDNIGATYTQKLDYPKALPYLQLSLKLFNHYASTHKMTDKQKSAEAILRLNLGECYLYMKKIDSAKYYLNGAYNVGRSTNFSDINGSIQRDLGEMKLLEGNKAGALAYFRQAFLTERAAQDMENLSISYLSMANLYHKYKKPDSAEYYAKKALDTAANGNFEQDVLNASKALYQYYDEANDLPNAYKYYKVTTAAKDSLYSQDKVKQLLTLDFNEKERQQELQTGQDKAQNRLRTYFLSGGLAVMLLVVLVFWLNGKQRQKANKMLKKQNEDIETAMAQVKLTQTQLIQSEKMASLGELTAGIAHEIQNPLNFVNNFSEINNEMIDELKAELAEGHIKEAIAIADDIQQNGKKINHHGKRADSIVKGMLQHSRRGQAEREPTNINNLAEEFFKLSYHGLRAKDKSFNSEMILQLDRKLPKVDVIQQDLGRVLLNLFNNAFYAVNQKFKTAGPNYKPEVTLSTLTENGTLLIKVKDNGVGIPDAIREKILHPFFTTKPTGEGTGLGLSLSYDILVKGHNGTLDVYSTEGEGSEFVVKLPLN